MRRSPSLNSELLATNHSAMSCSDLRMLERIQRGPDPQRSCGMAATLISPEGAAMLGATGGSSRLVREAGYAVETVCGFGLGAGAEPARCGARTGLSAAPG